VIVPVSVAWSGVSLASVSPTVTFAPFASTQTTLRYVSALTVTVCAPVTPLNVANPLLSVVFIAVPTWTVAPAIGA